MVKLAKRYAQALLKISQGDLVKAKNYRDSLNDLKALFCLEESARILRSPVMPNDLKKSLLTYGLDVTNAGQPVRNLVNTVVDAGRVTLVPDVADAYSAFIDEVEGSIKARVTTAVQLPPDDCQNIAAAISQLMNKKADVTQQIDSSLLGGFVVSFGDFVVDLSLKSKLSGLAKAAVEDTYR